MFEYQNKAYYLRHISTTFLIVFQCLYLVYLYLYFIFCDPIFNIYYLIFGFIPILCNFFLYFDKKILDAIIYGLAFAYNILRTVTIQEIKDDYYREIILYFVILEWITFVLVLIAHVVNHLMLTRYKITNSIILI
jgi:hypothetical protein